MTWRVPEQWRGATCFIVAGGPSVATQDVARLRGHKVIAINSSWKVVPFAQYLFFGDVRWFNHNWANGGLQQYKGVMISCAGPGWTNPHIRLLLKEHPPGLQSDPTKVTMRRTSATGAINIAAHLGCKRIVLLGVDQCLGPDGRTHHHEPHPFPWVADCFTHQHDDLGSLVGDLRERKIDVVNASPVSTLPWWPKVDLIQEIENDH